MILAYHSVAWVVQDKLRYTAVVIFMDFIRNVTMQGRGANPDSVRGTGSVPGTGPAAAA